MIFFIVLFACNSVCNARNATKKTFIVLIKMAWIPTLNEIQQLKLEIYFMSYFMISNFIMLHYQLIFILIITHVVDVIIL